VAAAAGFIKDLAGNANAAPAAGAIALDVVNPSVVSSSVACLQTELAGVTVGGLSVTASAASVGGTKVGVVGNSYRVSVVNQRGMLRPTVVVDDTAKTITVTADTAYHLGEDVARAVANAGGNADWTFAQAGDGTLTPTVIPGVTSAGAQICTVTLITSEAVTGFAVSSVVVNSVALGGPGTTAGQYEAPIANLDFNTSDQPRVRITMRPTSVVAAGSIAVGGTLTDVPGRTAVVSLIVS
jgi:hypothetical protein